MSAQEIHQDWLRTLSDSWHSVRLTHSKVLATKTAESKEYDFAAEYLATKERGIKEFLEEIEFKTGYTVLDPRDREILQEEEV